MKRTFLFIIIFLSLFWLNCASTYWEVNQTRGNYREIGWETCYYIICEGNTVSISVGNTNKMEPKIAIDWQKIGSTESLRLHVIFVNNQSADVSLFRYWSHHNVGWTFKERQECWQNCYIRNFPYSPYFNKLPEDVQILANKAVDFANKKYIDNYFYR